MVITTLRLKEITNLDEVHLYQQISTRSTRHHSLRKKFDDFEFIQKIIENIVSGEKPKTFYQQLLKKILF